MSVEADYKLLVFLLVAFIILWSILFNPILLSGSGKDEN